MLNHFRRFCFFAHCTHHEASVLDDSGIYLAEGDQAGFVTESLRLLGDPAAYATAVARTRARAAQITWQERARALAEFARSRF